MILVDSHCDTLTKCFDNGEELYKNSGHLDINRLKKYEGFIQFFAICIEPEFYHCPKKRVEQVIEFFYSQLRKNKEKIYQIKTYSDIEYAIDNNLIGCILSIEGGEALEGKIENVDYFHSLGVRSINITWNFDNDLADSINGKNTNNGLTSIGREVIKRMNDKGIFIDVSHCSDETFNQIIEISQKPVIASHSNSRAVCSQKRNLKDEQILKIAKQNGMIGVNAYPLFINDSNHAILDNLLEHIKHIINIGGSDILGIGADFDGIDFVMEDFNNVSQYDRIIKLLEKNCFSKKSINGIMGDNYLKFLKKNM